jgi:hypothetical protein
MTCGCNLTEEEERLSILQDFPDDASNTTDPGIPSDYSEYGIGECGSAQTGSEDV